MAAEMLQGRTAATFLFLAVALVFALGARSAEGACVPQQDAVPPPRVDITADPDQAANALFVQALRTIAEAEPIDDARRRLLQLERAQADLDRVVQDYPGSPLAVQLITNQPIGSFDPAELSETIAALTAEVEMEVDVREDAEDAACADNAVACGLLTDAFAMACEIPVARFRAEALALVSATQSAAGFARQAERSLAYALAAAAELGPRDPEMARPLIALAAAQASRGDAENARRTFSAAIEAVGAIEATGWEITDHYRGQNLRRIAVAQAEARLFEDALATAHEAASMTCQDGAAAFAAVGIGQLHAGLFDDARASLEKATLSPCDHSTFPMQAYIDVSIALAAAGFEGESRQTLTDSATDASGMIDWAEERAIALADIAVAQADSGYPDDARRTIADASAALVGISRGVRYAFALRVIALAQARIGEFADALAKLEEVKAIVPIEYTLALVAVEQAAAGLEDEARQTFGDALAMLRWRRPATPSHLSQSTIAAEQVAAGFLDDARHTFAEAVAASENVGPPESLSYDLAQIAKAQAEAGLPSDALVTVGTMPPLVRPADQVEALAEIGFAFSLAEDIEDARVAFAAARTAAGDAPAPGGPGIDAFSENLLTIVDAQTRAATVSGEAE